jgi:hypothetical protein
MSVDKTNIGGLRVADELDVRIRPGTPYIAVVCTIRGTGQVVGSIANVPRLDEFIQCIQQGVVYGALIVAIERAMITVQVRRDPS